MRLQSDRIRKYNELTLNDNSQTSTHNYGVTNIPIVVGHLVASGGPGGLWKIYSGCKKSTKAEVSIFVFEKKAVDSLNKAGENWGRYGQIQLKRER